MSIQYAKLCSAVIKQHFGETVQIVCDTLFASVSRTLLAIIKTTNLRRKDVSLALGILIKFNLVDATESKTNENPTEYSLRKEEILYILRFPKYVYLIRTKYGTTGLAIVEELLHSGLETASGLLIKCYQSNENKESLTAYHDCFLRLVNSHYLIRRTLANQTKALEFTPPELDLNQIQQIIEGKIDKNMKKDKDIFWKVNFQRFHQDLRDTIMISALEKKIGLSAGECFKYILMKMYEKTDPWQRVSSNPISIEELKYIIDKNSNNFDLIKYTEQYVSVISDDSLSFIQLFGNNYGGQYVIEFNKAFYELTICCIETIITQKFGSKAARIFRVIKTKKYVEQEDLQKEAMIPSKEAKLLTYKLFEEQYIQVKTIRKAGGGGSGPAKSFYLFYINTTQIVKMLLDICYKAIYNTLTRSLYEKSENKRLIDKSEKIDGIVAAIKERGDAEEYINEILETLTPPEREILNKVKLRLKILSRTEFILDETIFLLQMYLYYNVAYKESKN